jgi:hypothetical protein
MHEWKRRSKERAGKKMKRKDRGKEGRDLTICPPTFLKLKCQHKGSYWLLNRIHVDCMGHFANWSLHIFVTNWYFSSACACVRACIRTQTAVCVNPRMNRQLFLRNSLIYMEQTFVKIHYRR